MIMDEFNFPEEGSQAEKTNDPLAERLSLINNTVINPSTFLELEARRENSNLGLLGRLNVVKSGILRTGTTGSNSENGSQSQMLFVNKNEDYTYEYCGFWTRRVKVKRGASSAQNKRSSSRSQSTKSRRSSVRGNQRPSSRSPTRTLRATRSKSRAKQLLKTKKKSPARTRTRKPKKSRTRSTPTSRARSRSRSHTPPRSRRKSQKSKAVSKSKSPEKGIPVADISPAKRQTRSMTAVLNCSRDRSSSAESSVSPQPPRRFPHVAEAKRSGSGGRSRLGRRVSNTPNCSLMRSRQRLTQTQTRSRSRSRDRRGRSQSRARSHSRQPSRRSQRIAAKSSRSRSRSNRR